MSAADAIPLANLDAARSLVDAAVGNGVNVAVLSPGARSGPLAVALDERDDIESFVVTDERSAAFFALGLARFLEVPPLLLCTSGTAAANFLPAIAEASLAEVPLVVVTADRPPEARGFGAPQTIRQANLFEHHVLDALDAAVPSSDGPPRDYYRSLAARAVVIACGTPRGPVHLNVPFREPLLPSSKSPHDPARDRGRAPLAVAGELGIPMHRLDDLAARARAAQRGLLVCGPTSRPRSLGPAVMALANRLGWPLLADPLSGARCAGPRAANLVEPHDAILRSASFRTRHRPDLIFRFGTLPTSKALRGALAEWKGEQVLFCGGPEWPDPDWAATEVVVCDPVAAARDLAEDLAVSPPGQRGVRERDSASWERGWRDAADTATRVLEARLAHDSGTLEAVAAHALVAALPAGAVLVVGNSMPIRDVDAFCTRIPTALTILGNRGANGIDGLVSTAFGAAAAARAPTALLVGDLGFLHDAAALQLAARHELPLLVVVVNNDGGGIFHALPCATLGDTFERCFATPHGLDLRSAAPLGGFEAVRVERAGDVAGIVAAWSRNPKPLIVEIVFDRAAAAAHRASVLAESAAAVEAAGCSSS